MKREYYSVAVDRSEVLLGSMDFFRLLEETEACMTMSGSDEDPRLYVLYSTEEQRNGAFESMKDRFRSALCVYSPHIVDTLEVQT